MDVRSSWLWPLATAMLGFVYVGLLVAQYARRHKMHQLMWAIGFAFYAVAAVMEAVSEASGVWDPTVYRLYIVLAASLVGFLGAGTLYLVTKKRAIGDAYLVFNVVALAVFLIGTFTAHLDVAKLVPGITVGGQALGSPTSFPRVMSLVFNIPGSLLLLGGSMWSFVKFLPHREYWYRAWANALIFVGTLLIAGAGVLARSGTTVGLYPAEMVASAVLLAGFLMAGTLEKGARSAKARHEASHAPGT